MEGSCVFRQTTRFLDSRQNTALARNDVDFQIQHPGKRSKARSKQSCRIQMLGMARQMLRVTHRLQRFQSWCIPMFQRASSRPKRRASWPEQPGCVPDTTLDRGAVRARSGGILCLPLSSYGKATTRFLDSRRKASLARNDVHLPGHSISGFVRLSQARLAATKKGCRGCRQPKCISKNQVRAERNEPQRRLC